MNLGALLQEMANPQPAEILESSGEQFLLYMVALGGCATKTGKGGLSVKKGAERFQCRRASPGPEKRFLLGLPPNQNPTRDKPPESQQAQWLTRSSSYQKPSIAILLWSKVRPANSYANSERGARELKGEA